MELNKIKPGILFFCRNGYVFGEVFQPVIEEMKGVCRSYVLVADYYLSELTKRALDELQRNGVIEEAHIIQPYPNQERSMRYHQRLSSLMCSLKDLPIDMIVLGTDSDIFHRYLLQQFGNRKIKKVILQTGTIIRTLDAYRKMKGLNSSSQNGFKSVNLISLLRSLKRKGRKIKANIRQWLDFYFFPYFYQKTSFPLTGYESLQFATGCAEHVICYDSLEKIALQTTNPNLKYVHVARQPLENVSDEQLPKAREKTGRLLVTFSGNLGREMPEERINRWIETIEKIVKLKNIQTLHIRFHPRTSEVMTWPKRIVAAVKKLVSHVEVIDTQKIALSEIIYSYEGMIGGPSSVLRVARAMNKSMFILGLPNLSDGDLNDQSWILGNGEGISWLENGKTITLESLEPCKSETNPKPKVSHILKELLLN